MKMQNEKAINHRSSNSPEGEKSSVISSFSEATHHNVLKVISGFAPALVLYSIYYWLNWTMVDIFSN